MKALELIAKQNPLYVAGAIALTIAALYWFSRQAIKDTAAGAAAVGAAAAETIAGVATGDNAVTRGTPYEGTGIFGTLGAATNATLGGVPQSIGESLGSLAYRIFHGDE